MQLKVNTKAQGLVRARKAVFNHFDVGTEHIVKKPRPTACMDCEQRRRWEREDVGKLKNSLSYYPYFLYPPQIILYGFPRFQYAAVAETESRIGLATQVAPFFLEAVNAV